MQFSFVDRKRMKSNVISLKYLLKAPSIFRAEIPFFSFVYSRCSSFAVMIEKMIALDLFVILTCWRMLWRDFLANLKSFI